MILPYLSYGVEAWFGASRTDSNKILTLQKKSVRAVFNLPFNSHTNDYFKNSNILKANDLYRLNLCSLVYKYTQPEVDLPCAAMFITNSDIHSYNTRHNHNLTAPRYNLTKSHSSFLYNSIHEWNLVPSEIKNCNTLKTFKAHLRRFYCSAY